MSDGPGRPAVPAPAASGRPPEPGALRPLPAPASASASASAVGQEIAYRLAQLARGAWPGRHRSAGGEGGFEFRCHLPLTDAPDARRLDLLASLREPFGRWLVRSHSLRVSLPVVVLADLSASMAFGSAGVAPARADSPAALGVAARAGTPPPLARPQVLADLVTALAWSAGRSGDAFGFIGCTDRVLPEWLLPPTRQRSAGLALAERLRRHQPAGRSAAGLIDAVPLLGRRQALVWLVSDFQLPPAQLQALMAALAAHAVVPVVLASAEEADLGPRSGLATVHDAETGRQRLVWWRPRLRQAWQRQRDAQRQALQALMARHQRRPVWLDRGLDVERLNRHFQG